MAVLPKMQQSRFADLSLFHSAVDEILARKIAKDQGADGGAATIARPDPSHPAVQAAACVTQAAEATGQIHATAQALDLSTIPPEPGSAAAAPVAGSASGTAAAAICDTNPATYCASLARNYALAKLHGRKDEEDYYQNLLCKKESVCDPHWSEAAVKYAEFVLARGKIPYRGWKNINDYTIDGKLPANGRVAIIGDWGTGQPEAKNVLAQIARKQPDVVIHLGDIYYSATEFEVSNYFYDIWSEILNLPVTKIPTFTLSGNHDMFCGGAPFYNLLDKLGQPASYFCLRNDDWQLIAIDTGLHDAKPDGNTPTFLEDSELEWLTDKVQNCGGRKNVLLSHHQLFSAFEDICGQPVNAKLNAQVAHLLPQIKIWLWGHEHNQVLYKNYMGVLARCIGHGAFPIATDEIAAKPKFPQVPIEDVRLGGTPFLNHGYVLMDMDGPQATLSYYQDCDENKPMFTDNL